MRGNIWYLSETDLICLIWLSLATSIFLQRTYLYSYSWLKKSIVYIKLFFNPSVVWFRLVPQLVCCELCYNKHGQLRTYEGAGEIAQGLKALAALPEVLSWIPSPTWQSKTIYNSRECGVLFCSARSCMHVGHIHSCNHIHGHINFSKMIN